MNPFVLLTFTIVMLVVFTFVLYVAEVSTVTLVVWPMIWAMMCASWWMNGRTR